MKLKIASKFVLEFIQEYSVTKNHTIWLSRKKKLGSESPKHDKSPQNSTKPPENQSEPLKQLNGSIKKSTDASAVDSNYNSVKEIPKSDFEIPPPTYQQTAECRKEEIVIRTKTPTHERR